MNDSKDWISREDIENENREWLESLDYVYENQGSDRVISLLQRLQISAQAKGIQLPFTANTPYINTIPPEEQPAFPGDRDIERRIKSITRWNAMAMVVRANRKHDGLGGHISTYASSATLYEIFFNHFYRAKTYQQEGDIAYFQGHAAPGIYARAFLEGRLSQKQIENFRQELQPGGGLPSYPHPYLLPEFWQFPTVSMGLGPIMAIYQARFIRYLENRGIKNASDQKVWAFLGDGELDEPESLGAITLAAREKLDNLVFVVNCNLQRLDGPVRGNGKIIQELEAAFRGAGWNAIKVIWGDDWDPLLKMDKNGLLVKRMQEVPDGQYQLYSISDGDFIRQDFFGKHPELEQMVARYSNEQIRKLRRGGHDPLKVYSAYKRAMQKTDSPTVILAKTIKGYGLGEAGEGRNVTHQQKKLNEHELRHFRSRFDIPIADADVMDAPFYLPAQDSVEMAYLKERRAELGGYMPARYVSVPVFRPPGDDLYAEFLKGSDDREVATTMVMVRLLGKLLADKKLGKYIVPIVPDEARTFGMEALFRKVGIYSSVGQVYEPVDKESLLYYKEIKEGQILEEGITEAGSMSSFIAAGTAYSSFGVNMIPFFLFYSMFGFQRIGDLIWAAGDSQARGFLLGGTAGRTTLAGEGLQHQDGHSHMLAYANPSVVAYDPAFAFEIAVIVREGLRRMLEAGENIIYYLTMMNEFYQMPAMPEHAQEGIIKGMYRFRKSNIKTSKIKLHLLGSGSILNEVMKAQTMLENEYGLAADIWSVTSYKNLYIDAMDTARKNMLFPEKKPELPYIARLLQNEKGVFIAASDYLKVLPESIASWIPGRLISLGTDGYGRSDTRAALRRYFEVDAHHIVFAALSAMAREKQVPMSVVKKARQVLDIDPEQSNPYFS